MICSDYSIDAVYKTGETVLVCMGTSPQDARQVYRDRLGDFRRDEIKVFRMLEWIPCYRGGYWSVIATWRKPKLVKGERL